VLYLAAVKGLTARVSSAAAAITLAGMVATAVPHQSPGSAAAIKRLVAASVHIKKLAGPVAIAISNQQQLDAYHSYHTNCGTISDCVYGNTSSSTTVVLFGDSHALMWMPAAVAAATKDNFKLVVVWKLACPIAALPSDATYLGSQPTTGCSQWRTSSISAINSLSPNLVILSERTSHVVSTSTNAPFTQQQWQAGLATTISALRSKVTRVAVLEDLVAYTNYWPNTCVVANAHNVQACSIPNPNPATPGQQVAEGAAATSAGAFFIKTAQWFCTTTRCSPVVGNFPTHYDWNHVSAPYARYLSGVFGAAIERVLVSPIL
jgi:hypothetical protein